MENTFTLPASITKPKINAFINVTDMRTQTNICKGSHPI